QGAARIGIAGNVIRKGLKPLGENGGSHDSDGSSLRPLLHQHPDDRGVHAGSQLGQPIVMAVWAVADGTAAAHSFRNHVRVRRREGDPMLMTAVRQTSFAWSMLSGSRFRVKDVT